MCVYIYKPWGATSVKQEIDIFRGTRTSAGWCPLLHAYCRKKVWLSEAPCQHTTSSQHVQVCLGLETTSSAARGVFGPFPADYTTRNGGGTLSHLPPIGGAWRPGTARNTRTRKLHQNERVPVKAPAVKPCIVYITLLPCSVGSKGLSAYRFVLLYFTPLLADLVKYRLSAVALLLCYGDPSWPSSRRSRVRSIDSRRAKCSRGQSRADGRWGYESTCCCVFHFHTKRHDPNL